MQYKSLSLLLLTATSAFAASHVQKRQEDDDQSLGEHIDDFVSNAGDKYDDIKSDFEAAPSRVRENFEEWKSEWKEEWETRIDDLNLPTDFPENIVTRLPDSVRTADDWFDDVVDSLRESNTPDWFTELPQTARDDLNKVAAGITEAVGDDDDDEPAPTGSTDEDESSNPAARPTGAVMASFAGAAGVLGLAIVL